MGEKESNQIKKDQKPETKEIIISRILTENDIEKFNEMSPIIITLKNTRGQNPSVLSKLNNGVTIRLTSAFDEKSFSKYASEKYFKKSLYSPAEVATLINMLQDIEGRINPEWSDLEKATYGYVALMTQISPKRDEKIVGSEKEQRPFAEILNRKADSSEYAILYKELLERIGIPCRYYENDLPHAWNEVLINGEYYPADLFYDASLNEDRIKEGSFELRNFLSDKEFYYNHEHQMDNIKQKEKQMSALDHSEIQKAIDKVMHPENEVVKKIPPISLKSKELQEVLGTDVISDVKSFDKIEDIKINFENKDTSQVKEDLVEIGKYYPEALNNITLSNTTGTHINMQEVVDAIYEARSNEYSSENSKFVPSQITIESSVPEDFDIDFSKAPEIDESSSQERAEDISYSQKISFVNTSSSPIKLPNLSGKIPASIDTIRIQDFDLNGFDIRSSTTNSRGGRRLELVGGNTHNVSNLIGLDQVISISVNGLSDSDFDDILHIAAENSTTMPRLFELEINNQNLAGRALFSEIKNPNIVNLYVYKSRMNDITGIDTLGNQLLTLSVQRNDFSIEDLKKISNISKSNPYFRYTLFKNSTLESTINGLSANALSDETYNYLDSYFRRSGYIGYRNLQYSSQYSINQRKKTMLDDLSRWSLENVPYFIEDAKLMRDILPYTNNPFMVKDLATFENYLNSSSNYFEADYLKDGTLWLTKEQLEYLINSGKTIPQKVCLKINTVSELTNAELDAFQTSCTAKGINLSGVTVFDDRCIDPANPSLHNFDEIDTHLDTYEFEEYKKIRTALEEITDGILPSMTDAEKFAIVYHRLAQKISIYDPSAHGESFSKEHAIYQAKMRSKARNLSEGLIEQEGFDIATNSVDPTLANRCVCAGYADILKNALDLVGVESIIDSGNARFNITRNEPTGGHEWNKVKIDGKWYYADLCWDAGRNRYNWALRGSDHFERSNSRSVENREIIEDNCHITYIKNGERSEIVERDDFDPAVLKDLFYRAKTGDIFKQYEIAIPDDPDFTINPTIDINQIKDEYKRRKDDMLAKYYGDREYQQRYNEIAQRYRENEIEVTNGGITYRTVQDYAEREEDEKFLILGEYKNSLERMTKYDAGDTSVYSGTPDQIMAQYNKDKEYVETRNYTFDQHKNTQKDLATLGKFGETMPYIPKQNGIIKNSLRVVGNVGIFARNLVAPVYRFVGRNVAQPLHRLITRGKDASPYRNNPYHRFVARRDYFKNVATQADAAEGRNHPIRNYIMSNVNAVLKYRDGNEAVLNAGAYDIQNNLKQQELQRAQLDFLNQKKSELETQISFLENEIANHADAKNLADAQTKLASKKATLQRIEQGIISVNTTGKIIDIQTDAVSQTQHDIASKEVNTYRVAAIKGVAKLGIKKFVGPKIKDWLLEHTKQKVARDEVYQTTVYVEKEVKDPSTVVPITEQRPYYDIEVDDLIERAKGRTVKMYRSVSGGNRGEIGYTINGDEVCTGFHFQNGTTWGTGYSSNVPLMTDQSWPTSFLDASNHLREDLTFSEIAEAISNGELSQELLDDMTLQIGNKGWVYASELFEGVTKEVEVGSKVIEGATHMEMIPEIVDRTRTVYDIVDNERVVKALNTLGVSLNVAGKVDSVHSAEEIIRPTNSNVDTNKTQPRRYSYDDSEFYR